MSDKNNRLGQSGRYDLSWVSHSELSVLEPAPYRGNIDAADLKGLDLVAFNDGKNPWNNPFIQGGFVLDNNTHREIVSKWGFVGRRSVADIGSGFGRWAVFLAEANERVTGFERNAEANKLAAKLCLHLGLDNARFETSDVANLPARDGAFDSAWCVNTLHIVDRGKCLREIWRVLEPGGLLHIGGYNGAGRMLERFFEDYKTKGVASHRVAYGLDALIRGPTFDGPGSYGTIENAAEVLDKHGFRLLDSPAPEATGVIPLPSSTPFVELLDELPAFARRLQIDKTFADEVFRYPELAKSLPTNIALVAVKE